MKKAEIKRGGLYLAKVNGVVRTVRVDSIREVGTRIAYDVTNLATGRTTTFRSAAKFRGVAPAAKPNQGKNYRNEDEAVGEDPRAPYNPANAGLPKEMFTRSAKKNQQAAAKRIGLSVGPNGGLTTAGCPKCLSVPCVCEAEAEQGSDPIVSGVAATTLTAHHAAAAASSIRPSTAPSAGSSSPAGVTKSTDDLLPTDAELAELAREDRAEEAMAGRGFYPAKPSVLAQKLGSVRLAKAVLVREAGSPVAGMVPSEEQEIGLGIVMQVYTLANGVRVVVFVAGAGCGKTAQLKMIEQTLPGRGQYTAFNKSLVEDSRPKFLKASVNTTHSLAFQAVGKLYAHRLPPNGPRMRSEQVAAVLGIEPVTVELQGQVNEDGSPKLKVLQAGYLAGQVMVAVRRFVQSDRRAVSLKDFAYIDGIDTAEVSEDGKGRRTYDNNDRVKEMLLPAAQRMWADVSRVDGVLPFSHDYYVKLWQLGTGKDRPVIAADYIMLDEYQDTAPVFLDVLKQQTQAMLVMVGDDNQRIYEWRGAVNAGDEFPDAPRAMLSQSYRFGQAIADVANSVLETLDEPTELVMRGSPSIPSRVCEVAEPKCYLYRTNAGALSRFMAVKAEGKRPHLIGGGAETVKWCQAALDLQEGRGTSHPELGCFTSWAEVVEYSITDEGDDLRLMCKLVEEFGAAEIRDALKDMPDEEDADVVLSTAHKSKGREWPSVKLGGDFPTANKMEDSDRRLLYVALTRAQEELDVTNCPPFCGGHDQAWGEDGAEARWIPGLSIAYTQEMPTAEQLEMYRANRPVKEAKAAAVRAPRPAEDRPRQGNGNHGPRPGGPVTDFTWTNHGGEWCIRGPRERLAGERVKVVRKNGTSSMEVLGKVLKQYPEAWIYASK